MKGSVQNSFSQKVYLFIKRTFDVLIGLIGVILMLIIAVFVKIAYLINKDYDSIFFSQDRIGKDGKLFKLYKFRTMILNADEALYKLLENDKEKAKEYKKNKKLKNDPRITKAGRFLRKSSLDEVPQFINILIGNMSLIGNRPYLPREEKEMGKYYKDIVKTKPGLTGFWQVSGTENPTFQKRLELEESYSKSYNLLLDIKIFFMTFKAIIVGHGAKE